MDNVANIKDHYIDDIEKTNIFGSVYAKNDNSNTIQAYSVPDICYPYDVYTVGYPILISLSIESTRNVKLREISFKDERRTKFIMFRLSGVNTFCKWTKNKLDWQWH